MKIYQVKTQELYDELMKELEEKGYRWDSGALPTEMNHWKNDTTCVQLNTKVMRIIFADIRYYKYYFPWAEIIEYKGVNKMKIYHVKTQELYDQLMKELEEQGFRWGGSGHLPTAKDYWEDHKEQTAISAYSDKKLSYDKISYWEMEYPDVEIVEYKGANKMKTVEYDNVFPKEVYDVLQKYKDETISAFWCAYGEDCFSDEVDEYIEQNEAKISIALATGRYECEAETLYYVHFVKGDSNSYLRGKLETGHWKTKFTEAEIKQINPAYWNEAFLELVDEEQ